METNILPDFYSSFMKSTPSLTREEEMKLSKDVHGKCENKRKKAIDKLVESNIKFAIKIAMDDFSWFSEKQDLISEAVLGLQKAAEKYDAQLGAKFSTYAVYYIRRQIFDYVNKSSVVSMTRHTSNIYFKIQKVITKFENEFGRAAKTEEISEELGISEKRIENILNYKFSFVPLDSPLKNSDGDTLGTISQLLKDENAIKPDEEAKKQNDIEQARDFFKGLNERETFILRKRFGFDGEEPMILQDIGNMLNVTRERVRQLQDIALKKIKKNLKKKNSSLHLQKILA